MTLNLFLAYIPFELSLLLRLFKPNKKYERPLFIIYSFIFVLLLPNTFYMVTDLIHLNQFQFNFYAGLNLGEWKYFTYLLLGVFLAVYVMILIYFEILTLFVITLKRLDLNIDLVQLKSILITIAS